MAETVADPSARRSGRGSGRGSGLKSGGIRFQDVTVAYNGTVVLDSFTLDVAPGEVAALLGPSGSGKTTALRAVAGFVRPASGRVYAGGRDVTDLPPYKRGLGMVVQQYALFPHMRVEQNVAFGLKAQKVAKPEIPRRVAEALRMTAVAQYAKRYPRELSGGQQQRVAIARALAIEPSVLLLDEPLSALDAQLRSGMLAELARLHRELPDVSILYVTHDQIEALTALLSSAIALIVGTWAALALDAVRNRVGKALIQTVFMVPIAVPSVVVGLALLVAFSQGPVLLNGTTTIVVMAHAILVTAYAFQQVSAAVTRLDPAYEQAAASLGARPYYTLLRVKRPLLLRALTGSLALCFALSMGELGATAMVYSADWTTLPLRIYALDDRGHQFVAAAVTAVMMTITLAVLLVFSRIRTRADYR